MPGRNICGQQRAKIRAGNPARLRWMTDGRRAVAATQSGEILFLDGGAKLRRTVALPAAPLPSIAEPLKPVVDGVPVYSVGFEREVVSGRRVVLGELAYVGSIWLVKTGEGGFLVDGGGSSNIPATIARIKAAGLDMNQVRYLLQSHSHGDHCGAAYLWRTLGLKIVAPEITELTANWLMPTMSEYAVWVPRRVDLPLALKRMGDETESDICGVRVKAILMPGHSPDSLVYLMELNQKRIAFTGDVGFQHFIDQLFNDVDKTREVMKVVQAKVIPWHPEVVFTGHGVRPAGSEFLQGLLDVTSKKIAEGWNK